MLDLYDTLTARLRAAGDWIWPFGLRAIMFWEFWESGTTKLKGSNWFADIPWADWQKGFPWPFSDLPNEVNWFAATWGELVFAVLILFGLFTRFAAISLIVITAVAAAAVHWPAQWDGFAELWEGYVITAEGEGNFKLALLFILMLLPLVFHGGGRLSLDYLLVRIGGREAGFDDRLGDAAAASLAFLVLAVTTVFLEPVWGIGFFVLALAAAFIPRLLR